jgi:peptide/nickel transport system substrate-binding protein
VLFARTGGTRFISFNTTVKPFDNINIRRALIAASNRNALRLTRGGAIAGDIANGYLPPGIPGYEEAGGVKQNTDLDYLKNPNGDPALAKEYMLMAKQEDPSMPIDASGTWT